MRRTLISTFLSLSLWGGSLTLAIDKPKTPQPAQGTAVEAGRRAAAETAAAVKSLGASPTNKQISTIVFKAVRSSHDSVLPIVAAAVHASPRTAAQEIVTAATAAVPNPWKQVIYRRMENLGTGTDDRANGIRMMLAEAIVRTAFDADPTLSFTALQNAANTALRMDPATLMRDIQSPRAASGTGDAGISNYANEPLLTPRQPAVSR